MKLGADVSFFTRPVENDDRLYRRVGLGLIFWLVGFFGLIIVPLLLNGWNRSGLFADIVWRVSFGGFLLASGLAAVAFSRTLAEFQARRDERAWPVSVVKRLFFSGRPYPFSFPGHLVGHIVFGLLMAGIGFSICIDRFPHPR